MNNASQEANRSYDAAKKTRLEKLNAVDQNVSVQLIPLITKFKLVVKGLYSSYENCKIISFGQNMVVEIFS